MFFPEGSWKQTCFLIALTWETSAQTLSSTGVWCPCHLNRFLKATKRLVDSFDSVSALSLKDEAGIWKALMESWGLMCRIHPFEDVAVGYPKKPVGKGKIDQNLWSLGLFSLTHSHVPFLFSCRMPLLQTTLSAALPGSTTDLPRQTAGAGDGSPGSCLSKP